MAADTSFSKGILDLDQRNQFFISSNSLFDYDDV
jgi:hypothetical protein